MMTRLHYAVAPLLLTALFGFQYAHAQTASSIKPPITDETNKAMSIVMPSVQRPDLVVAESITVRGADSASPTVVVTVQNRGNVNARTFRTWVGYRAFGDEELGKGRLVSLERTLRSGLRFGKQQKINIKPKSSNVALDDLELIEVYVDSRKSVYESSEDNNAAYFYLEDMDENGVIIAREKDDEAEEVDGEEEDITTPVKPIVKQKPAPKPEQTPEPKPYPYPKGKIFPWINVRPNSGSVALFSVYPTQTSVEMPVLLRGSGFLREGNVVVFEGGYIVELPSSDLETISFTVPRDRVPLCAMMQPACMMASPYNPVTPGEYKVSVLNSNGWSAPLSIRIVAKESLKNDPYKPIYNDATCLSLGALLPGCHKLPENDGVRFDSTETKYIYSGMRNVMLCSSYPVIGCNRSSYLGPNIATTTAPVPPLVVPQTTSSTPATTTTTNPTTTTTNTTATNATAAALAYREGLYFKAAFTGCMARMNASADMTRLQEFLNAGQFPPPWGSFTGNGAIAIATCEREAGWMGYETGSNTGMNSNWASHVWRFKDGSTQYSSILSRVDSEYTSFIASVDAATLAGYFDGWKPGGGDQSKWQEFGIPVVSPAVTGRSSGTTLTTGSYTYSSAEAQAGCTSAGGTWNTTSQYCQMPGTASGNTWTSGCTSTQYWNGSSCVPMSTSSTGSQTSTSCGTGLYWNGSACVTSTTGSTYTNSCGTGYYWNGTSCQSNSTGSGCVTGQYWNGSTCVDNSSSASTSCGTGYYWNGSLCASSSSSGSYTSCPSGQWWNGSACTSSSTTDMSASCASAGGTWNSTTNYCQMPGQTTSRAPSASQLANVSSALEAIKALLAKLR